MDQRGLTFGIQWDVDTAPLDDAAQKEREVQEESQRTADSLDQIGVSLQGIGARAGAAFDGVTGAGADMGTSIRAAMLQSIQSGQNLGQTLRAGVGAALDTARAKAQGFGAGVKSVCNDIKSAIAHPVQTIKVTLGQALQDAGDKAKEMGAKAQDAGEDMDAMGRRGGSAADSLGGKFSSLVKTIAGLAILKQAVSWIKDFAGAAINAAANAEETQSKFETVFGSEAASTQTWIDNFSSAAKRSKQEIKGFLADSQAMMKGLGMSEQAGAEMSKQITSLSYDLASFHNIADQDAFDKIRSGLMGETEGLKSLGIVMNEAAIHQAMLAMGYTGNTSELRKQFNALDEATKAQIRFQVITTLSGDALTDVTRTAGSYTNGLKGIKGVWQDFLADAGAKFTPVLTSLFNTILTNWPTIEPMLMGVVEVLSQGFSQAIPVLLQLGSDLLPVLCSLLSTVFSVIQPLIPVVSLFAQTVLPPLASILALLVQTLLPPITQILTVVISIIQPLMPVLMTIAQAILPPVAQLLGLVAPILQAIAPILQVIGQILGIIATVIGTIIGWVADGVGKVVEFFSGIFGGAKEAAAETDKLADSMADLSGQTYEMPDVSAMNLELPETSAIEIPMAEFNTTEAQTGLQNIQTTSGDMYQAITAQSESAWDAMGSAAKTGADGIILQFRRIKEAADHTGGISIKATVSGAGASIPRYAGGTDDHPGGWARINDGPGGGELAYLPGGTAVVPADKTDRIIGRNGGKVLHFAPVVNVALEGRATEEDKAAIEEMTRRVIREEYERLRTQEAEDEAIQEAIS